MPTQTQLSQGGRTHEDFCINFCCQIEKHRDPCSVLSPTNNDNYQQKVAKVFTQLCDEKRWNNFTCFLHRKCQSDGGDLLSRFAENWFIALNGIDQFGLHQIRMLRIILDCLKDDSLQMDPLINLSNVFENQIKACNTEELGKLAEIVFSDLSEGTKFSARWVAAASVVVQTLQRRNDFSLYWEGRAVDGGQYVKNFINKLIDSSDFGFSYETLIYLIRKCNLESFVHEYVASCIKESPSCLLLSKLFALLPLLSKEMTDETCSYVLHASDFSLDDISPLSDILHSTLSTNSDFARTTVSLLKRDHHLLTSRQFPLIVMLILANTPRYRTIAVNELKQTIVRLWKYEEKIRKSAWIHHAVGECDMKTLEETLIAVIRAVSSNETWSRIVGQSVADVAFALIPDKGRTEIRVIEGRLDDRGILSVAKQMLLATANSQSSSVGVLLERIFLALSSSPSSSSSMLLIDTIVEIVMKHTVNVLNSWKTLHRLIDVVCSLKDGMGVAVIRALLPVIIQRPQLITAIVEQMKKNVLCEGKACTAVPILVLLLRSSTMRSAIKDDQFSQSFATFSTQALKSLGMKIDSNTSVSLEVIAILRRALSQPAETRLLLYRGIVEAAYSNENITGASLDLLLAHLLSLPPLCRQAYVESTKSSTILIEPLSELIQAVSILTRLSIHASRNTSTQEVMSGLEAVANKAIGYIYKYVEFAVENDVHDMQLDKLADFSSSALGRANIVYSRMILSLYDVLIEHLWHLTNVLTEREAAERIVTLQRRREELEDILKEKMAKRKETKGIKASVEILPKQSPQLITLTMMARRLILTDNDEANEEYIELIRESSFTWLLRWAESVAMDLPNLAAKASLISLSAFAKVFFSLAIGGEAVNPSLSMDIWEPNVTRAVRISCTALSYIFTKYGDRATTVVIDLWRFLESESHRERDIPLCGAALRILRYIFCKKFPALLNAHKDFVQRKTQTEFSHQAVSLISLCRSLLNMIPNTNEKFRIICLKLPVQLLHMFPLEEKSVLKEMWHYLIETARRGDYSSAYTSFLKKCIVQITATLSEDSPDAGESPIRSISEENLSVVAEMVVTACLSVLSDIRIVVEIISQSSSHRTEDMSISEAVDLCGRIGCVIELILPLSIIYFMLNENVICLLSSLYSTLDSVVKFLLTKSKKNDVTGWKCVNDLANVARGCVLRIMENADENLGMLCLDKEPAAMRQSRKYAKALKDETLYVSYVRMREQYQANLLLLSAALKNERLDVQVRNNAIGARDFRIDAQKLTERIEALEADDSDDAIAETQEDSCSPSSKRRRLS